MSGRLGVLVAGVAAAIALTGCGSGDSPAEDPTPEASAPPSTPARAPDPEPPPAPRQGECYVLDEDALTSPTDDSPSVPCRRPHTAQTIYVGQLKLVYDGHAIAVDSARAQRQVSTVCPQRFEAYVGGSPGDRDLSRLRVVWYSPTLEEADAGARWFRCDLIAFGDGDALHQRRATVPREVLSSAEGRDRFGLCGTAAPGAAGFERVLCSAPHSWRALGTIALSGEDRYPGADAVREQGDSDCADLVREAEDFPLEFTYGWEWPTREQWAAGQRFGYCWGED